jgi:hypothetical protein
MSQNEWTKLVYLARHFRRNTSPQSKTADRPHWITIVIGILSPSLAAVAVAVSMISLNENQHAFKVGQRAYVTVSPIEITEMYPQIDIPRGSEITKHFPITVSVSVKYEIKNLGNTPAFDTVLDLKQGGATSLITIDNERPQNIGPKEVLSRNLTIWENWTSADNAYSHYTCLQCYTSYEGNMSYRDVFGDTHHEPVTFDVYVSLAPDILRRNYLHKLGEFRSKMERAK